MHFSTVGEILQDVKQSGKERPWKPKKERSLAVLESFNNLGLDGRAERLAKCAAWMKFLECRIDFFKKLIGANFCRDRMCPMCNWRRSLKLQGQIIKILHKAAEIRKMRYIFVTLTVKNMTGDELNEAITSMLKAFKRFIEYEAVDKHCIGYVRNLEITYNAERDDFHPHIHVLLAMDTSYFGGKSYINKMGWVELWQKAHRLDYSPSVYVKEVKTGAVDKPIWKAAAEVGKYSVEDSDYIFESNQKLQDKVINYLASALKGRRLISFGKMFRDLHKELNLQDVEADNADLIGNSEKDCTCPICQSLLVEQLYRWNYGYKNYISAE
jgi:plasmid rolling circle replication initiator protein Rep